jgi:Cft2 family RNA processing exonuclease
MENCLKKCVALNYGEIYDTDKGIKLVSYPSGREIGGSVWLLESVVEREKILWIQEICHHQWRACKQFSIP